MHLLKKCRILLYHSSSTNTNIQTKKKITNTNIEKTKSENRKIECKIITNQKSIISNQLQIDSNKITMDFQIVTKLF